MKEWNNYFFFLEYFQIKINIITDQIAVIALKNSICQEPKYQPYTIQHTHHIAHIQNIKGDNHFTFLLFNVRKICGIEGSAVDNHATIHIISNIFIRKLLHIKYNHI